MTLLSGCKKEIEDNGLICWEGFTESKMIIEVTSETKFFRIETEGVVSATRYPEVSLDTLNTSAKDKIHFINTVDDNYGGNIGEFIVIPNTKKSYRDVEIISENITKADTISYMIAGGTLSEDEPETMIKRLMVILQPENK